MSNGATSPVKKAPLASPIISDSCSKDSSLIKEGWLNKQGNYIKNWRQRFFQLRNCILTYYKEPMSEKKGPTNFFILSSGGNLNVATAEKLGPFVFELTLSNGEKRFMQASSKTERDEWIAAIANCINLGKNMMESKAKQNSSSSSIFFRNSELMAGCEKSQLQTTARKLQPDDFNFIKVLGKGNYGKVMLATLKDPSLIPVIGCTSENNTFAVKIIKKSGLVDEEALEHVLAENRLLQNLNHPFLVKLYASFQTKDRLYFVMELIRGGELFFHIGKEKKFSEAVVKHLASQITLGLIYIHSKGVAYRDLKLENILLDSQGHVKITDFGLCKEGLLSSNDTTSTFCGTPEYLAPEILEEEAYGRSVDWWALGVVLYELLIGRPPFGPANNMEKLFYNILHQPIYLPSSLSLSARSLLEGLLTRDHTKRLGCGSLDGAEIINHPFFEDLDWKLQYERKIPSPFIPVIGGETDDVRNFDPEFTKMPAILTPATNYSNFPTDTNNKKNPNLLHAPNSNNDNISNNGNLDNLKGFTFVSPNPLNKAHK